MRLKILLEPWLLTSFDLTDIFAYFLQTNPEPRGTLEDLLSALVVGTSDTGECSLFRSH